MIRVQYLVLFAFLKRINTLLKNSVFMLFMRREAFPPCAVRQRQGAPSAQIATALTSSTAALAKTTGRRQVEPDLRRAEGQGNGGHRHQRPAVHAARLAVTHDRGTARGPTNQIIIFKRVILLRDDVLIM